MYSYGTVHAVLVSIGALLALSACNVEHSAKSAGKTATSGAVNPNAPSPVATVNGNALPQSWMEVLVRERAAQGRTDDPELRKGLREELINREVIVQEATKQGFNKNPDVVIQVELAQRAVLARGYVEDFLKRNPVGDEALKAEYDKVRMALGDKEYKARHILVASENEAKLIIVQLQQGAKFEKLAAEYSRDTGSNTKGGELDWKAPASYVKPFAEALVKLKKTQHTKEPVRSQFGWHVIRMEDERPLKPPPFEDVKMKIHQRLQQQQLEKLMSDLRAKAKID